MQRADRRTAIVGGASARCSRSPAQRQEMRFASPSLQSLPPLEQGPVPADRRHGQTDDDDPLQVAGGSKQPISEATDDAVTQN